MKAGLLPQNVLEVTEKKVWTAKDIQFVLQSLKQNDLYLTNIVKCTGSNADLPSVSKIRSQSHLFLEELEIVQPKLIIAFGLLPFKALTRQNIKLKYFFELFKKSKLSFSTQPLNEKSFPVIPCYFPVGRGNPKQAVEILQLIQKSSVN